MSMKTIKTGYQQQAKPKPQKEKPGNSNKKTSLPPNLKTFKQKKFFGMVFYH